MRVILGSAAALVLAATALAGCGDKATSKAEASGGQSAGQQVTAVGCPATPKANCVAITTDGQTYDITAANVDLAGGHSVSLTGTTAGVMGACGQKLTNVQVEYQSLKCGTPTPPPAG